ncbi:MAG: hypothetical protein RL113_1277 [Pseudomonadota bacterium]|jgi:hypothetical protein
MDMVEITPVSVGVLLAIILVMVVRENFKLGKENSKLREKRTHSSSHHADTAKKRSSARETQKDEQGISEELSHYAEAKEMIHKGIEPSEISEKLGIPLTEINLMVKFEKIKQKA